MRQQHGVLAFEERWLDGWFVLVDVEPRAGDDPFGERLGERPLVDDRTTRGVDQDRRALHAPEPTCVDQVTRLGDERDVKRHEVAPREKIVEAGYEGRCELAFGVFVSARVVVEDRHREPF